MKGEGTKRGLEAAPWGVASTAPSLPKLGEEESGWTRVGQGDGDKKVRMRTGDMSFGLGKTLDGGILPSP